MFTSKRTDVAAPRFFVSTRCSAGAEVALEPDDAYHVARVLRANPGDSIVLIDADRAWQAQIGTVSKDRVLAHVIGQSAERSRELSTKVSILQAVVKGSKFDQVVEKTVELGAHRVVPVIFARSYADVTPSKMQRWRRVSRAAAQQSRRSIIPEIAESMTWDQAIAAAEMPVVVGWEGADRGSLANAASEVANAPSLALAVGPEGSFTEDELEAARSAGYHLVSLGPTILRTETAAAALLAAMASKLGWW